MRRSLTAQLVKRAVDFIKMTKNQVQVKTWYKKVLPWSNVKINKSDCFWVLIFHWSATDLGKNELEWLPNVFYLTFTRLCTCAFFARIDWWRFFDLHYTIFVSGFMKLLVRQSLFYVAQPRRIADVCSGKHFHAVRVAARTLRRSSIQRFFSLITIAARPGLTASWLRTALPSGRKTTKIRWEFRMVVL